MPQAVRKVRPGSTIYIDFDTFAKATGAPVTITNFAVGDLKIYKNGSTTERASTSGYALQDTDGIDFDGITGIHGATVDLADNTTADHWQSGAYYRAVCSTITVDGETISATVDRFIIGEEGSFLDTFIATLSSQTSFTLNSGPAEDDALNGLWVIIHDAASAVQRAVAVIIDYVGSTKTVTLAAAPTFTIAAKDNISVMGPVPLQAAAQVMQSGGRSLQVESDGMAHADLKEVLGSAPNALQSGRFDSYTGAMASNVVTAAAAATDFVQEIRDAITGYSGALSTDSNGRVRIVDGTGAGELDTSSGLVALTAASLASINSEVDTALADYDGPTNAEMVARTLAAASYATASALATAQASIDDLPTNAELAVALAALPTAGENAVAVWDETTRTLSALGFDLAAGDFASNWLTADGLATDAVQEVRNAITGGAYPLDTDVNGAVRIVDGTGARELDTSSGRVIAGTVADKTGYSISGTIQTLDALDTAQDLQHAATLDAIGDLLTTAMSEDYAANGDEFNMVQGMYAIHQTLMQIVYAGESATVGKLDGTTAFVIAMNDDENPTSLSRAV